ncbi:MAG: PAS domain-containing protein [Burkholderiaceae bacterium]
MDMNLRQKAEALLEKGAAPFTRGGPAGTQALTMLHGLASAPETASAALKLLHELQVHQVELDLQHEQTEQECRQLTADLTYHTALFDLAPFAYLSLDPEGLVIAANRIAADWFAPGSGESQEWAGRRIEDLLAPECRAAVRGMLAALRKGEGRQTCAVQSRAGGASATAVATATRGDGQVLMAFVPAGPGPVSAGH